MLLTCCATSLFMRTDSSRRTAAHQLALYKHPHGESTHPDKPMLTHTHTCMPTDEHTQTHHPSTIPIAATRTLVQLNYITA